MPDAERGAVGLDGALAGAPPAGRPATGLAGAAGLPATGFAAALAATAGFATGAAGLATGAAGFATVAAGFATGLAATGLAATGLAATGLAATGLAATGPAAGLAAGMGAGAGAGCGGGAAGAGAAAAGRSPGPTVRRFTFSTTTAFERPCEKLCRTMLCSAGRFSDRVLPEPTLSVLSPLLFVSLIRANSWALLVLVRRPLPAKRLQTTALREKRLARGPRLERRVYHMWPTQRQTQSGRSE